MLTFKQLDEMGASIVGGRVVYQGRHVEGEVGNGVFIPAPGEAIGEVEATVEAKPRAARAKKPAAETPAEAAVSLDDLDLDA